MPIYKLSKSWSEMSSREFIMYVLADNETDAHEFVEMSVGNDLPNGLWKNHEEGDDPYDTDDHDYSSTLITENDLTNTGLRKQGLMNISPILRDFEQEQKERRKKLKK